MGRAPEQTRPPAAANRRTPPPTALGLRRRTADRSRRLRWVAVVIAAASAAALVGSTVSRAERARARWSADTPVVVAVDGIAAGEPLAGAVAVASWPADLVPDGSMAAVDELPAEALAATDLAAGSPIGAGSMELDGSGWAAIAIPSPPGGAVPDIEPGDRVQLWATWDPSLAGGPTTRLVAEEGRVLDVGDAGVTVGIDRILIADAVEAVALATVTIVVSG